jgi:hypothetical protein
MRPGGPIARRSTRPSRKKWLVFSRPWNYKIERVGSMYRAHLTQDSAIHRRGEGQALQRKAHRLDYEVKDKAPSDVFYYLPQVLPFRLVPVEAPQTRGRGGPGKTFRRAAHAR